MAIAGQLHFGLRVQHPTLDTGVWYISGFVEDGAMVLLKPCKGNRVLNYGLKMTEVPAEYLSQHWVLERNADESGGSPQPH